MEDIARGIVCFYSSYSNRVFVCAQLNQTVPKSDWFLMGNLTNSKSVYTS